MNIRAIIINLEKDSVKRYKMISLMEKLHITEYEILKAVDGRKVSFNQNKTQVLFNQCSYEYSAYKGDLIFRKRYLNAKEVGCSLSHHLAINNQKADFYSIILEDDGIFISNDEVWQEYIKNLPRDEDYDIIFFSDCTWLSTPYQKDEKYNDFYSLLPKNYFNYSGTHAYLINPRILPVLNESYSLILAADDYLSYCINKYSLKALVSNDVLFTQNSKKYLL